VDPLSHFPRVTGRKSLMSWSRLKTESGVKAWAHGGSGLQDLLSE
jgi:hypothetical protein